VNAHGKVGNRGAYLNQEIDIDDPEQPVGACQVGIGSMAKSDFSIIKRKRTLTGSGNSIIIEHGAKLENATQITHCAVNTLFLATHDTIQA
jgi:hypothetical protein